MITITDLKGDEHAITAIKKRKRELNGNDELKLIIHQQKNRTINLIDISELWIINYQTIKFKIVYLERITYGDSFYLEIRAIPLFYDEFSTSVIHYAKDGSTTSYDAFQRIFEGTSFTFVQVNNSLAKSWDGFGKGQNRLELFKKALDKFGYEFYIEGSTVYLKSLVGNDTNFMYKYKLNASDVKQAVDATGMYTYIQGFGDIIEESEDYFTDAKLRREYKSPLYNLLGKREAPPIVDGRIKLAETMDEKLKYTVDNSLNVTVTATLHDLRKQGYDIGVPTIGDRTFLVDERINVNVEIRVYALEETYDEMDKLVNCDITFGSQGISERYTSQLNDVSQQMSDILDGRVQLPFDVLASKAKDMLLKIQAVSSELVMNEQGIFAIDKNNPNNIVGLNSAGWFISTDGGRTAKTVATASGIVADAITTGNLNASLITTGYLNADLIKTGTINADLIKSGSINGTLIRGGSIDASLITTGSLNASIIKTGSLDASLIKTGSLDASLIKTGSLDASLIKTGQLSANRISGGLLTSQNGNMSLNLDTGAFNIYNSVITYNNKGNALRYSTNGWTSGMTFTTDTSGNASVAMGSSNTSPSLDYNHTSFTGFIAVPVDQSAQIWGKQAIFIEDTNGTFADSVWSIDIDQHPSRPVGTRALVSTKYKGLIGGPNNYMEGVYTKNLNNMKVYTDSIYSANTQFGIMIADDKLWVRLNGKNYDVAAILRGSTWPDA